MRNHNTAATFAVGMAGAMMGAYVYQMMTPKYKKDIQKKVKKAVDELSDVAMDIGEGFHDFSMHR